MKSKVEEKEKSSVRHPGGLERYYAPRTPMRLVATHALDKEISAFKATVAVVAFFPPPQRGGYRLRPPRDPPRPAKSPFPPLRELARGRGGARLLQAPPPHPRRAAG